MAQAAVKRLPDWLRRPPGGGENTVQIKRLLREAKLNTVCEEARCPNIDECFSRGTATFMILGDVCTRGCRFCAVTTGVPVMKRLELAAEAERLAESVEKLKLKHVVVTSVARDDLEDGGAEGFALSIAAVRKRNPETIVEVLVPDLNGDEISQTVIYKAVPDILNHNLETVPRLYRRVRPRASYQRSLELLSRAKSYNSKIVTKTGIMVGLGEEKAEVYKIMADARESKIDIFTLGQYMQPTRKHLQVVDYVKPEVFEDYRREGERLGFRLVLSGPLVRSSYYADQFVP